MADDGETIDDCHAQDVFAACSDLDGSFLEDLLKSTHACTHTHTCNPPGPSTAPHTHTCVHTHTQLFAQQQTTESFSPFLGSVKTSHLAEDVTQENTKAADDISAFLKKRPPGNREAVKKYREKKKARTAYLEEQVVQLRSLNEQLLKRLQGHAVLEAELFRLRTLLAEFRGRINGELGVMFEKSLSISQLHPQDMSRSYSVPCTGANMPCPQVSGGVRESGIEALHEKLQLAYSGDKAIPKYGTIEGTRKSQDAKPSSAIDSIDCNYSVGL